MNYKLILLLLVVAIGAPLGYKAYNLLGTVEKTVNQTGGEAGQTLETLQKEIEETSEETRETIKKAGEAVETIEEKLEKPKILSVDVEVSTTSSTISWKTDRSVLCTIKVEQLGRLITREASQGLNHQKKIGGLLPSKEYDYIIECTGPTGSVDYLGAFTTKSLMEGVGEKFLGR